MSKKVQKSRFSSDIEFLYDFIFLIKLLIEKFLNFCIILQFGLMLNLFDFGLLLNKLIKFLNFGQLTC